jgi:subtilase family serine protease
MVKTCVVCFSRCVAVFLLLCVGAISYAQAAAQDRVLGPVDDSHMNVVEGNRLALARPEFDQGRADGAMKINRASIVFKPSPAQQNALEALLAEQQDSSSANYHKWLTPEQYADRFGMTPSDLAKVASWLRSKGLAVNETARGRNQIFLSGTVAQIEDAFRTEIHHYQVNGETHFANAIEPSAPAAFADAVRGFRGLDDFRPKPRSHVVKPHFTSSLWGNHYLAPGDFVTIYDLQQLYDSGFDGTGEAIAVVGDSSIAMSDIEAFRSASHLPANDPQIMVVPGTGTPNNTDEAEADLDLEWSGAVAKGADIIYVVVGPSANNGAFDALSFAIQNNVAPVISNSFGNCEANLGGAGAGSFVLMLRQEAQQANLQGQTITSATGDSGAADCEASGSTIATSGLAVDVPASIPEVTGVGGSEFMGDLQGVVSNGCAAATPFWSSSCSPTSGPSALSYITEMAWNDSPMTGNGTKLSTTLSAGGGGASAVFGKPPFQTFVLTPHDNKRDVPDISLNASLEHDAYLFCTAGSCVNNSYRGSDGQSLAVVGGTSAGAPTFAGILAIINQATKPGNPPGQGNANPELYTLAMTTSTAFHDITTGSNRVPCQAGSPNCPSTPPAGCTVPCIGFTAVAGYDQATGLGSIDANVLVRNWTNFSTKLDFAVGGTAVNLSAPGQSGSSMITVIPMNGFGSTMVNLSLTTPCPAAAFITCTLSPSSVSVNGSSATATLSVSTMAPHALAGSSAEVRCPAGTGWFAASAGTLLAGFFALGVPSRRRRWTGLLGLLFLTFVAAGLSCGGSSPHQLTGGTPVGTYTVTITAADASGTLSHATNVTITVQ